MHPSAIPLACFLSMIRPPGVEFENSYLQLLPVDKGKCPFVRSTSDVGFRLFTRHNPTTYEELFVGDDRRLAASHLDFADRTVICFHAFLENPDAGSSLMLREAFILRGDTNVILVDAQRLEAGPWYLTAADNTWYIGQFAAQFIDYLVSRGLDLKKTHLIGHSLGAQSAGVAGSVLKSGRVARITGLDPALPLFNKLPAAQKLDAGDAEFVDVIHTDAGIFGVNNPVGHADFYPNAGISPQPGCELEVLWPRQMLLEKCANRETHKPLDGYYMFQLERHSTPHASLKKHRHYGYNKLHRTKQDTKTTETPTPRHTKKDLSQKPVDLEISYQHKEPVYEKLNRKKRFISFFRRAPPEDNDSFLFKMLDFLIKNRKSVIPVVSVMREINTLVKSANGELSHSTKERNNYIGTPPPVPTASTFSLELGKDSPGRALVKRLLGLGGGDKLTIGSGGGLLGK